jgi:hypothetical protein
MYAYTSQNEANIALRNSLAQTYNSGVNSITGYPSIPYGSPIFTPSDGPVVFAPGINSNRSFVATRKPIKKGGFSFDTDLLGSPDVYVHGAFGIIAESDYAKLQAKNYSLTELNVNPTTKVQIVSTSPLQEFTSNSQIYWTTEIGSTNNTIWAPNWYGFPTIAPFWDTTTNYWNFTEIPLKWNNAAGSQLYMVIPGQGFGVSKMKASMLFDQSTFTKNIDIRDHEFYIYGTEPQAVAGSDFNYTYIRIKLLPTNLLSMEDGILVNNFYNFKLFVYGHNGQMSQVMSRRPITSAKGNWSEPSAYIENMAFGIGTTQDMTDIMLESNGSLYITVAFPKSSFNAINAFRSSFKTIFKLML